MTYTIVARCADTGMLGIAQCSVPIALGARCPFIESNVGAISTQAFTDPGIGPLALKLLTMGFTPEKVIKKVALSDRLFEWRQLAIVDQHGRSAAHTGARCMDYTDQITAKNLAVVANHMKSPLVVRKMAEAFEKSQSEVFEERLMLALEAGRDEGGDRDGQNSAVLRVFNRDTYARTDLRVDLWQQFPGGPKDAVDDLRRLVDHYKPLISYYESRPSNADVVPAYPEGLTDRKSSGLF